jgi:general secretion pathway protein D
VQPAIQFNKVNNTLTIRASTNVAAIIERIIQQNDKPRAEIVVDVEILEVNRTRAKTYGLNLSEYAVGLVFSPEVSPGSTSTTTTPTTPGGTPTTTTSGTSTGPSGVRSPPPFNLNTITQGVSTADFYLAVPTAVIRALESDTNTKLIAKPQLRGAEGSKMTLKLGDSIPIIQTSYTPLATGGAGVNPLSSYNYKDIGVNVDITPKVTLEGDILMDLTLENLSLGAPISVAGVSVPSFGQRSVTAKLRLRDGESNLLAGLLREDERKSLTGFPGAIHVPILQQLFSNNDTQIQQTDIVMLLTPHIIRTSEITEEDLKPIFIGSQQNLGVQTAPVFAVAPPEPDTNPAPVFAAPATPPPPTAIGTAPGGVTVGPPPGSSPIPGTVVLPAPTPAPPTPQPAAPPTPQAAAPATPQTIPQPPAPAVAPTPSPTTTSGVGLAQVIITPPGTTFRVGAGPYTVPIAISNVSRISTLSITVTFDPAVIRIRTVQEGSFMRSGGVNVTFAQQQSTPGRLDITIARTSDATGASGTGLLAALLVDAIAPGTLTFTMSGAATGPGGTPMGLQFRPVTVSVQP